MTNDKLAFKNNIRNATLLLGSTMTVMAGAAIAPAIPQISLAFENIDNNEFIAKLLLTIPALVIGISAPFCGIILDKYGRKNILIFSMVLYGIAGSLGFFLDNLIAILASRIFLGIGAAGVMTGFTTLIGDYFKGHKLNIFMGYQSAFMALGGVVFLFFSGILADISWNSPFLVYSFAFIVIPFAIYSIYEPEIISNKTDSVHQEEPLPIKNLGIIYSITFISWVVLYMIPVIFPFHLKPLCNVTNTHVGIAMSSLVLFAAITSMFYDKIKTLFSYHTIFIFSFVLIGTGYILIALTQTYYFVFPGMLITGIGQGLLFPNLGVWLINIAPENVRGRAIGGMTTCVFIGQFSCPILTAPIIKTFGNSDSFIFAGLLMIILGILFFIRSLFTKTSSSN
ncbi:MAG: MFS transporter [Cyanobacteriota bacterium]